MPAERGGCMQEGDAYTGRPAERGAAWGWGILSGLVFFARRGAVPTPPHPFPLLFLHASTSPLVAMA